MTSFESDIQDDKDTNGLIELFDSQGNEDTGMSQISLSQNSLGTTKSRSTYPLSQSVSKDDSACLPAKRKRTRVCVLCHRKGCGGQFKCNLLREYGSEPLKGKDKEARLDLATKILDVNAGIVLKRDEQARRPIMKNFPKRKLPAVILHKKFITQNNVVKNLSSDNVCIECTFLKVGGEEDIEFTKVLFHAKDVARYVQKTMSNVVVSLVHKAII